jgi:membrane-bound lytic murein transglycosylase D
MDIFDFNNHGIKSKEFTISPETFDYLGRRNSRSSGDTRQGNYRTRKVYYHSVRRGDNLSSISEKYGVPVATLKKLNGMGRSTSLQAGKRLRIR